MKIASTLTNLMESIPTQKYNNSETTIHLKSKKIYQNEKYTNPSLATPVLQPIKNKVEIPPLEDFPSPAIPVNADSLFDLFSGTQ